MKPIVTPGYIAFGFEGITPLIRITVFDSEITVGVFCGSRLLDNLVRLSMAPVQHKSGLLLCRGCANEGEYHLYPNLNSMRQVHLYAPLLRWVNEILPEGKFLEIVQFKSGHVTVKQLPYTYQMFSEHVEDFMEQLEMKFEIQANSSSYRLENIAGFYYAPLFGEAAEIGQFISRSIGLQV